MSIQSRRPAGSPGSTGGQFAPRRAGEAEVTLSDAPAFQWGGYGDYDSVEPFYEEYLLLRQGMVAGGGIAYGESFKGKIPGLAGHPREGSAIYMLQKLHSRKETQAMVESFEAEGGVEIGHDVDLSTPVRVASVAESGFYVGGYGFRRREGGRVTRTAAGNLVYLPPGHSRNGYHLTGQVRVIWRTGR